MSALPLVLGWLVLAAEPTSPAAPAGYVPPGAPVELHDLNRLPLLRDPGVRLMGFSAREPFDARDGLTVLAETDGPGIVQRLWLSTATATADRFRPTGPGEGRLRVTIDQQTEPVLDVPLTELFAGAHPRFPGVVGGARPGGFVAYIPIPFRDGCRITLEGAVVRPYEISVLKVPSAAGLARFQAQPPPPEAHDLQLAFALWREPEAIFSNEPSYSRERLWRELSIRKHIEEAEYPVDGTERSTRLFALPDGPRTIRSFDVVIDPKTADNWRSARLRITWDGANPASPSVDLPLGDFFGLPDRGLTYRSLLTGENEHVWSNRFPMPYRAGAMIQIDADGPIRGAVRVRTQRGPAPGAGYFRAASRSQAAGALNWESQGERGHLVGTFLQAKGRGDRSAWLAKSLYLIADGQPLFSRGTPLAQAFDAAWSDVRGRLDMPQVFPLSGFPAYEREGEQWKVAAYRWRLVDPVPFERSIGLRIEPDNAAGATTADDVRATVFWYSERSGPARPDRPK